ncbi:hypothetical protein NDU88_005500 [Pleurodeles waltl]|uniref:Uncharacterized protein n=1 Tax=Pleurodeles waltl TaxID=8319 RepID=A0AAV7L4S1_PLEWA|nr:hypothetical protein NDU88_005500 [Pleurodeles waltl]
MGGASELGCPSLPSSRKRHGHGDGAIQGLRRLREDGGRTDPKPPLDIPTTINHSAPKNSPCSAAHSPADQAHKLRREEKSSTREERLQGPSPDDELTPCPQVTDPTGASSPGDPDMPSGCANVTDCRLSPSEASITIAKRTKALNHISPWALWCNGETVLLIQEQTRKCFEQVYY